MTTDPNQFQAGGDNKIKTSPVTGYAVFADGKRVTDVDSPSSESLAIYRLGPYDVSAGPFYHKPSPSGLRSIIFIEKNIFPHTESPDLIAFIPPGPEKYFDITKLPEITLLYSGDHALVDLACIGHFNPKNITVRSKSRDLLSTDSVSVTVPTSSRRRTKPDIGNRSSRGLGRGRGLGRRGGRREMVGGQMVIDHEDDNLSDKEVYGNTKNIPAIGEIRFLSCPGQEIKIVKERLGLRV